MMNDRSGRRASAAFSLGLVLSLSACSTLGGFPRQPEDHSVIESRRTTYYGSNADKNYVEEQDPQKRRGIRDDLVYGKMQVLEDQFQLLERTLNASGNLFTTGSDLAVLALNGLAATTGGTATKSALSAASAGIVGAQGAINKDLYYQRTLPALLAQMEANREVARLRIIKGLALPDAAYPLAAAEIDLKRLTDAGSLPAAVSNIAQQAEEKKVEADKALEACRSLQFADTPSANKLNEWVQPGGKINDANFTALQTWMDKQPDAAVKGIPVAEFVRGDASGCALEPIRQRAIADPALNVH